MRVAVVGAGVTGLTAAFELSRRAPDAEIVVLESSDRVGGKVLTTPFAGHDVDCGADAFLARVPEGIELCRDLGLDNELVTPATRQAYVYSRGDLRRFPEAAVLGVPTDLEALSASGAVSAEGVRRAAQDLTLPGEPLSGDESVGSLVRRRVGDEVFERLVGPLLSGVNAGDADQLSVQAGAPQLAAAVRDQPSLIAGLRAQRAASGVDPNAPVFFGLPGGTQRLTDTLAERLRAHGVRISLDTTVHAVDASPEREATYRLRVAADDLLDVDGVVLATPDFVTARLLESLAPDVVTELDAVDYASVVMVTMALPLSAIERPLDGSGFLVAQPEGLLLTACSWASSKWAHLRDTEVAIVRLSAGRFGDRRALDLPPTDLVQALTADLVTTMGLDPASGPSVGENARVTRWVDALPQFRPGHLDRVERWQTALTTERPRLLAVGAGFAGLGVPACIRQGRWAGSTMSGAISGL